MWLDPILLAASAVPFGAAVVVIAVGFARVPAAGRAGIAELVASLGLGLELMLAAGLLRLSAIDDLRQLATVAFVVLLRKLLTTGLRYGLGALGQAGIRRLRA